MPSTATRLNKATLEPRSSVRQMEARVPGMMVVPAAPKAPKMNLDTRTVPMFLARAMGMKKMTNLQGPVVSSPLGHG